MNRPAGLPREAIRLGWEDGGRGRVENNVGKEQTRGKTSRGEWYQMDPHGVLESLVIEIANNAFYNIEPVIESLPYPMRVRKSLFTGKHLPLTYPLPKRIDKSFQGHAGLMAYDLIAIAGVDVNTFTPQERLNLASYVLHGGALILFGGSCSFGKSDGTYQLLEGALPADIPLGGEIDVYEKGELGEGHPVTKGLVGDFGMVSRVHPLEIKPEGKVLLKAGGHPVVVAGEVGKGRVVLVATYPETDHFKTPLRQAQGGEQSRTTDGTEVRFEQGFFAGGDYRNLMRQAISWLLGRDSDLSVERFEAMLGEERVGPESACGQLSLVPGATASLKAVVSGPGEGKGKAIFRILKADERLLSLRREPQFEEVVSEREIEIGKEGETVSFTWQAEDAPSSAGLYRARMEFRGKDPNRKRQPSHLVPVDEWAVVREVEFRVKKEKGLTVSLEGGKYVFNEGMKIIFVVEGVGEVASGGALVSAQMTDSNGAVLKGWSLKAGELPARLDYEVPNLARGEYTFTATMKGEGGETLDSVEQAFYVVDPVPQDDDLRFVGSLMRNGLTENRIRQEIEDRLRHGFNVLTATAPIGGYEEGSVLYRRGDYSDWLALDNGMMLWGEYEGISHLTLHGPWWDENDGTNPTRPCVLTPEYRKHLREFLGQKFSVAERIPRLLTMEILDEPHALPPNVCHCEVCEKEYERRYGEKMPSWRSLKDERGLRRLNYFNWVGDYFAEGFKINYEIIKEVRKRVKANHVIAPLAWGRFHIEYCLADDLKWTPYCDTLEFDNYCYMYANFRCAKQLPFHDFHYEFAAYRQLGRKFDKRIGFFIQLDDRDYPQDVEPIRAPAELAYTAIGQGAKDFHLMFKPTFAGNFGLREEKWDDFGGQLVKIRQASPVIANSRRMKGKLAMVFSYSNHVLNPSPIKLPPGFIGIGFYRKDELPYDGIYPWGNTPYNGFELLLRGFGEAELIHETLVAEGEGEQYRALALWRVGVLSDAAAEKIVKFVREGGLLLCDQIPGRNEKGEESHILDVLFSGRERPFYGDLRVTESSYGEGKTLLFNQDIDDAYSEAILGDNRQLWDLLEEKVRDFLFQNGVLPHAYSENPQIEASLFDGEGSLLLVTVNHSPDWEESTVYLYNPPIQPKHAIDLITMDEIPVVNVGDAFAVDVELSERRGQVLGLYTELPSSQRVEVGGAEIARGDDLSYTISLLNKSGKPCRGRHVVEITVVDGEGKAQPRYGGLVSTKNGVYARTMPIALNEVAGEWTISAFDRFTREKNSVSFQVK